MHMLQRERTNSEESPIRDNSSPPRVDEFGPRRNLHVGQWTVAAILLIIIADILVGAVQNPNLNWPRVGEYFFDSRIIAGLGTTLSLALISQVLATALGAGVAMMSLSDNIALKALARVHVTLFRSIPTVVQMLFWYFLAAVVPVIGVGIPFGPDFIWFDTNQLITQFAAALLGLVLGQSAFLAEYFRGGILSVPKSQLEAAASCGLTPWTTFRRVVVPQALRVALPSYGNSFIINVKNTSVVFAIGVGDLMTRAQLIYSQNFQQIPLLIVVIGWYLVLVILMTVLQRRLESHYSRGYGESRSVRPLHASTRKTEAGQ